MILICMFYRGMDRNAFMNDLFIFLNIIISHRIIAKLLTVSKIAVVPCEKFSKLYNLTN